MIVIANWKMNGRVESTKIFCSKLHEKSRNLPNTEIVICPAFVHIPFFSGQSLQVGAQDCSAYDDGAFTGDVSAAMLAELGCLAVIAGHSERRENYSETSENVSKKAEKIHANSMTAVICVGETQQERAEGKTETVLERQLRESLPATADVKNTVIAYEPVWAIGSGKPAKTEDIHSAHKFLRQKCNENLANAENMRIVYGGSVKGSNAAEIFAIDGVDGGLIGGASLKADEFTEILEAAEKNA